MEVGPKPSYGWESEFPESQARIDHLNAVPVESNCSDYSTLNKITQF